MKPGASTFCLVARLSRSYAREWMRKKREASRESDREASRAYYARNQEKCREKSRTYRLNNPEKLRETRRRQSARQRALRKGAFIENVDHDVVFERDRYVCCGCGISCDPLAPRFAPNKPTLDHITPISKGGKHSYDNVQTLCWKCNHLKRDKELINPA